MDWKNKDDDAPKPGEEDWVGGLSSPAYRRYLLRMTERIEAHEAEMAEAKDEAARLVGQQRNVVVQFPPFPAARRPVLNDAARSALFSCVQGKDRAMLDDELIATVEGIQIRFTGKQFNQDDHDVLMQLVHIAAHQPLGEWVTVSAHALLKALGRKTGKSQHEQLRADLTRLMGGTVSLKNTRTKIEYIGHLLEKAVQDEESHYWTFQLNPDLRALYSGTNYTLVDWERRKKLHGKDLARWLQAYIATHAALFPIKVATLRELSGSRTKEIFSFRQTLRKALQDLTGNGDIAAWAIDPETDLVTIDRGNGITDSQQRHLNKNKDTKTEG